MFVLISSEVSYDFVDPLQSTVLTPLAISSKYQNNIGTYRSYIILDSSAWYYCSFICDNGNYRILKDRCLILLLVAMGGSGLAMLPHMCGNRLPQLK